MTTVTTVTGAAERESVAVSELSRDPEGVVARVATLGRLRITDPGAPDLVLATAAHEAYDVEGLTVVARLSLALMRQDGAAAALLPALVEVYPWARHLGVDEGSAFAGELLAALAEVTDPGAGDAVRRVITSWRATAATNVAPEPPTDPPRPPNGA
ncbi:prevent-host-death family protein [Streptomyces sp. HSW2009]|uniref:prevent-host-death family protein n=1 Tax=Streptomyces sp. HSW2009 TaxID=3142890 RepID=UPI0032EC2AD2